MSYVNFGMSFVLKGIQHPKIAKRVAKKELLDGVFQIHLDSRQFAFLVKGDIIHTVSFSSLYDAQGNPENKYVILMLFNGSFPCELHAQNEAEREVVHRLFQNILAKTNLTLEDRLGDKTVHKQATVKKKGKMLSSKRAIILNTWRHCVIVFYEGRVDQSAPSYHILLHHRVTIANRKRKSLQIIGTYKNLWIAFKNQEERDSWYQALTSAQLPPPVVQIHNEPSMFEHIVSFDPEPRKRKYIPPSEKKSTFAGPSPD